MEVVSPARFPHFGLAYGHGIVGNLRARPWLALLVPVFLWNFRRTAKRVECDLVHAHWLAAGLVAVTLRRPFLEHRHKVGEREFQFARFLEQQPAAAAPCVHQQHDDPTQRERHPAALEHFQQVCRQEREIEKQERRDQRGSRDRRPVPDPPDHDKAHHCGDHHGAGHRDAIGRGQRAGGTEQQHQQHDRDQQQHVDAGDEDLAGMRFRGVADFESRQQTELDRLPRQRIGPRDHRLARDHGRNRCKADHRDQRPVRKHQEERIFHRLRIGDDQRTLPHIVQRQRRQRDEQPGGLDRSLAEMPEIGVERFRPGHREKHRAEGDEADHAVMQHEGDGVERIERQQHFRMPHDLGDGRDCDDGEPNAHDRSEERRDPRGAARLDRKQRHQDDHGDRNDIMFERRRNELDAFDRR